ncbi:MAG: pilus assembly protein N-terminal domain-containing protein, partial [Xanthobacteraceae bacterium]
MNQYSTDRERTRAAASRWRLSIAIFAAMTALACTEVARADELQIQVGSSQKSASIRLTGGKSETVRTDRTFADVIVSDPEIADVVPLTDRSLSILGKKIGTTRVSVYAEGKKQVGIFDVEVSYD